MTERSILSSEQMILRDISDWLDVVEGRKLAHAWGVSRDEEFVKVVFLSPEEELPSAELATNSVQLGTGMRSDFREVRYMGIVSPEKAALIVDQLEVKLTESTQ